jgi:hypothetical protein
LAINPPCLHVESSAFEIISVDKRELLSLEMKPIGRSWHYRRIMQISNDMDVEDDVEIVPLALPLDRATIAWLGLISRDDVDAAAKIAEMLRMIREDDELYHRTLN